MKHVIKKALEGTERDNIEKLINFLEGSDFYTAPASTKYHLAYSGGLMEHSLNVLNCARGINSEYSQLFSDSSIVIAALAHDFCKINYYKEVYEPPTDPQKRYLTSLMSKAGLTLPVKLNKAYAGILIDFMLNSYKGDEVIPVHSHNYQVEDKLPLGHGEKSLWVVSQFIFLTYDEALAIRWHMGTFDLNFNSPYQRNAYNDAIKATKLVSILQLADLEATYLVEA